MIDGRQARVHVLLTLPAEQAARRALTRFTSEGIPFEALRVERRLTPPPRLPHRAAPFLGLVALVAGAVVGALVAADRVQGAHNDGW